MPRLTVAMEAAAEQYAHQALDDMLSKAFGKRAGSRSRSGFDVTISYQPGRPPPPRTLPSYDV